jgi:retron-type reverse transcriptase
VDADLASYFDTIPHEPLMERVGERIADGGVLKLIGSFLKADIMEEMNRWTPTSGAPQGAVRVDQWTRGRLRSILRRRAHRRGKAKGKDHQNWPNAYFAKTSFPAINDRTG